MNFKRNIVITGGAGFIGSHVVRLFVNKYPEYRIVNLDKLTYAGNLENLKDIENMPNYAFEKPTSATSMPCSTSCGNTILTASSTSQPKAMWTVPSKIHSLSPKQTCSELCRSFKRLKYGGSRFRKNLKENVSIIFPPTKSTELWNSTARCLQKKPNTSPTAPTRQAKRPATILSVLFTTPMACRPS